MAFGFSFDEVLSLDVLSFDDLVRMTQKLRASYRADDLLSRFYGAQADQKSVKEMLQRILKDVDHG